MKILKIIHGYPPDYNAGSEVYSQSICNELSKKHSVFIFTREENPYTADHEIVREVRENMVFYITNKAREKDGYRHSDLDEKFRDIVTEIQPDVAHIGHLNHLSTGFVGVLKGMSIPIVYTLHDFWLMCPRGQFLQINFGNPAFHQLCTGQENHKCAVNCYNRYFSGKSIDKERDEKYWEQWVESRMEETRSVRDAVDLFIAPSRYLIHRFITDFEMPQEKIIYLDYGFPLHYLSPTEESAQRETFVFGYIGTHIPSKGIDLLIQAFKQINQKARLMIWGRENGQSTKNLKKMANGSPNPIVFCGEYINTNLAKEVFSKVDCIVVPSVWGENSPLVIHEAQACGIPVITADFGGMSEYVKHQENGLLFTHRNKDDLAKQMIFAISHPNEMKSMGKRGYLHGDSVPDIETHCRELERIYHKIINEKS